MSRSPQLLSNRNWQKLFTTSLCILTALLISACGGSSSAEEAVSTPTPLPPAISTTAPDLTQGKLLSDTELETSAISPLPQANSEYVNWASNNHQPIRSITYDQDFSDLEFLKPLLENKRLVQLGESSHGTKEFNHLKVRMIKYLHQELGYNVIAFESGFFEGAYTNSQKDNWSSIEMMRFIFGVWNTSEVRELFRYVAETQSTDQPLQLAGFDIQVSSSHYDYITDFIDAIETDSNFSNLLKNISLDVLNRYRSTDIQYNSNQCALGTSATCNTLMDTFVRIESELEQVKLQLNNIAALSNELTILDITLSSAISEISNTRYSYQGNFTFSNNVRDRAMADNVKRLLNDVFPTEKIIVWGHNAHITHNQVARDPAQINEPMGFHLYNELASDIYSIGFYMLRGQTVLNDRTPVSVQAPLDNSLEAILHGVRKAALFIDSSDNQTQSSANQFLYEQTQVNYWGGYNGANYSMIPSTQYDGIIAIDSSSVPDYL